MFGKLNTTLLACTNFEASKRFYVETLGLKAVAGGQGWAVLDGGGMSVVLFQGEKANVALGFTGADLDAVRQELTAKGVQVSENMPHPGGMHVDVIDPDGNTVMISN